MTASADRSLAINIMRLQRLRGKQKSTGGMQSPVVWEQIPLR
jgi:hypothetical protein